MARLLIIAFAALIVGPTLAGPDILPIKGPPTLLRYDLATGEVTPIVRPERYGRSIWAATQLSGYVWGGRGCREVALDWGDIASGTRVGAFAFGCYATSVDQYDPPITAIIAFYGDDNGWNSPHRVPLACFELHLPGSDWPGDPDEWKLIVVEVAPAFVMDANDLDGDGLGDFSYTYWFDCSTVPTGSIIGPVIAGDPDAGTAPGIEDVFDVYNDPNYYAGPGYVDPNLTHYVGTYWFGGVPFAQFYMELFAPGCPNPGELGRYCTGDIDGSGDCLVNLADLAQLLAHYGMTTGATRQDGDIQPAEGDGDVDLADLAELLGQYGDNCN